jgi:nucleotide-binding universal stress UspA family protein
MMTSPPVVAGIEGSKEAAIAALWAADDADRYDTTLLLSHVLDGTRADETRALASKKARCSASATPAPASRSHSGIVGRSLIALHAFSTVVLVRRRDNPAPFHHHLVVVSARNTALMKDLTSTRASKVPLKSDVS